MRVLSVRVAARQEDGTNGAAAAREMQVDVSLGVPSLEHLQRLARALGAPDAFTLKYVDVEGDEVTIASDADVKEAVEYMDDEKIAQLVVYAKDATSIGLHQQLKGLISTAVAMARPVEAQNESTKEDQQQEKDDMSEVAEQPQQEKDDTPEVAAAPSVRAVLEQLRLCVRGWEVEQELDGFKADLETVLASDKLIQVLDEFAQSDEYGPFVRDLIAAMQDEVSGVEALLTDQLDVALHLAGAVISQCSDLKPIFVRLVKTCGGHMAAFNTCLSLLDPMPELIQAEPDDRDVGLEEKQATVQQADDFADLVHHCYQCDGCNVLPIRGVRYRSKTMDSFDLCADCYISQRFSETHGPFDPITEYKPVHFNAICDGCEASPITGIRYKSISVKNFDLCEACEASGKWISHEPFIKIKHPDHCPWNIAMHFDPPQVHPFVTCDGCGMSPLVGLRFKSTAVDDFDLCEVCKQSDQWEATHGPFALIERPRDLRKVEMCRRARRWVERRMNRGEGRHHHGRHHGCRNNRNDECCKTVVVDAPTPPTPPMCVPCVPVVEMPAAESPLSARFVKDITIPDGQKVAPDTEIVKAWCIQNDGDRQWPLGCVLKMQTGRIGICPLEVQGDMMSVPVPSLAPGSEHAVEVRIRTPTEPGRYKAFWRMCDMFGKTFGQRFWIDVEVSEDADEQVATTLAPPPSAPLATPDVSDIDEQSNTATELSEETNEAVDDSLAEALALLESMGFEDNVANRAALEGCQGDISDAIMLLTA